MSAVIEFLFILMIPLVVVVGGLVGLFAVGALFVWVDSTPWGRVPVGVGAISVVMPARRSEWRARRPSGSPRAASASSLALPSAGSVVVIQRASRATPRVADASVASRPLAPGRRTT